MNPPPSEDRLLSPEQIDRQIASLAVEALTCIERVLRGSAKANKAQLDTAWRVVEMARDYEAPSLEAPEVEELRNVLQLIGER